MNWMVDIEVLKLIVAYALCQCVQKVPKWRVSTVSDKWRGIHRN